MPLRMTKVQAEAHDAFSHIFASTGALAFINEDAGAAAAPAPYHAFADRTRALSLLATRAHAWRCHMPQAAREALAACIGLAWADSKHEVCRQAAGAAKRAYGILTHRPEALDAWGSTLRTRFKGHPLAVCLEFNKGPRVSALRKDDCLGRFPIKPLTLARSRAALTPSRATDAPTDAALQRALLLPQRDTLQPLKPQSPAMRALAQLVEPRRRVVNDRVRITNRLTSPLKNSVPHVLQWLQEKDPAVFCDVLHHWPTLTAAQRARRSPLATFFRAHHVRAADRIAQRLQAIKTATPLTSDAGLIAPHVLCVQALVSPRRVTLDALETFDHALAQRAQSHAAFPLCQTLPRGGPRLCPPAPRRLRRTTGTRGIRRCTPTGRRPRASDGTQRPEILGPWAPPMATVRPPNVRGVGGCVDPACLLGADL